MPEPEQIVVSIEREGEALTYRAKVSGVVGREVEARGLELGPEARVRLSVGDSTLGELLRRLFPNSVELASEELAFFDDVRTQREIGRHLFDQLFGRLPIDPREFEAFVARQGQELRIVTNDEHLVRLPWVLLASDATVLGKRWSVSLARDLKTTDVSVRNLPRVLLVMPEPVGPGLVKTNRDAHEARLKFLLEAANSRYRWAEYWKVVRTWEEFSTALAARDRDVVYFYGHGEGDLRSSRLLFETGGEERAKHAVTMEQLALALGDTSGVRLIYLNCCSGDAGGFLGAGMLLRPAVPAVFTNRTFFRIPMAQQSGEVFFNKFFVEGLLPHAVYTALLEQMMLPDEKVRSSHPVSWMTPVLHARYGRWESSRVQEASKLTETKSTALDFFDRSEQVGALNPLSSRLSSVEARSGHAVLWYGGKSQGVASFHQHLRHGLVLAGIRVHLLKELGWPPELAARGEPYGVRRSLVDGFCAILDISTPDKVSSELRARVIPADNGQRIACYLPVSFPFPGAESLSSDEALHLLLQLLEAFDEEWVPFFEDPFVPILGLAIEAANPEEFRVRMKPWMQELRLERIKPVRLPPLEAVRDYEVESYLQDVARTSKLLPAERDEVAQIILAETAGRYDDVVGLLKNDERLSRLTFQVRLPKTRTG